MNIHKVEFIKSAAEPSGLLTGGLPQIVFAGKSNVGKSSVINALLNRKNFARVGATPGKTVHINYFLIDGAIYFVDLPGYGFARVSPSEKKRWATLMEAFFQRTDTIALGILIVDARHKPTADDVIMANWFVATARPYIVLANKFDKLRPSERTANLALIAETLPSDAEILPFSAQKGTNRDRLLKEIENIAKH
ncbi:ribosome biogenesis GTP-binding protein YihA/YsxC [Oscillospiraceae bacterium WX1]